MDLAGGLVFTLRATVGQGYIPFCSPGGSLRLWPGEWLGGKDGAKPGRPVRRLPEAKSNRVLMSLVAAWMERGGLT